MQGPFLSHERAPRSPASALMLMLAGCAAPPPVAPPAGPRPKRRHVDRRRHRRVRRLPELGLSLPWADPQLSGDRQDPAVPRCRRQRPARPFEPARRPSVGGPDLQRPHACCSPRRKFRSRPAGRHRRLLPRQQGDARRAMSSRASRSCASSPIRASTRVLVAPQLARRRARFERRTVLVAGRLRRLPRRGGGKLGDFYPQRARRVPPHAGRHRRLQRRLSAGGLFAHRRRRPGRVRGVVLLDALYGERDKFVSWVEGPGRNAFFVSAYSTSSRDGNMAVEAELEQAGLDGEDGLPATLAPARSPSSTQAPWTTTTSSPPPGAARRCATYFPACGRAVRPGSAARRQPKVGLAASGVLFDARELRLKSWAARREIILIARGFPAITVRIQFVSACISAPRRLSSANVARAARRGVIGGQDPETRERPEGATRRVRRLRADRDGDVRPGDALYRRQRTLAEGLPASLLSPWVRSHYDVFPEIPEAWKAVHRRCLEGATESSEGDPFRRADGRVQWVRWSASPWRDSEGEIGGLILTTEDITARKEAEAEAAHLAPGRDAFERRHHRQDLIDRHQLERGATRLLGYEPEEMIGGPDRPHLSG